MNRTPVTKLTESLRTLMVAITDIQAAAKEIIQQPDNRDTLEVFEADIHTSLQSFSESDILVVKRLPELMEQLAAVLYFQEREAIAGKQSDINNPGFRSVYDNTKHLIKAVVSLRTMYPGIDLHEARLIVEAYKDGILK